MNSLRSSGPMLRMEWPLGHTIPVDRTRQSLWTSCWRRSSARLCRRRGQSCIRCRYYSLLLTSISIRYAGNRDTYRYWYAGNFSNIAPLPWLGAFHSSKTNFFLPFDSANKTPGELPMIFGTHPNYRGNSTPFEYAVSETMQDLWLHFAEDSAAFSQYWPAWDPESQPIVVFGADAKPSQVLDLTSATDSPPAETIALCASVSS